MIESAPLIEQILRLAPFVKELAEGGFLKARRRRRYLADRLREHSLKFETLADEYAQSISRFQKSVLEAGTYEEIGLAVIELRASRNVSSIARGRLAGELRAFSTFVEKHRRSTIVKAFDQYLAASCVFFDEIDNEGTGNASWATALAQLAESGTNRAGVDINFFSSLDYAKERLRAKTDEALANMSSVSQLMAEGNEKFIGALSR